ncbi:MAG: SPFH domain-containing protein, partial [Pseudolabrys sp.]
MRPTNSFATLVFIVVLAIGATLVYAMYGISTSWGSNWLIAATLIVAFIVSFATKVADQWDRAVVLRLGRFHVLRGPGLFFIIPIIDTIPYWIDTRVITSSFTAERTLTRDTVPVNVDAVLFWKVVDPMKAALDV